MGCVPSNDSGAMSKEDAVEYKKGEDFEKKYVLKKSISFGMLYN